MKSPLGDKERILHIRDAIQKITTFTVGFNEVSYLENALVQSAVERQFEIIGEAVAGISDHLREKYTDVEWYKIRAFRNFISHEYFGVSAKQVWAVVAYDLPLFAKEVDRIISENNFSNAN